MFFLRHKASPDELERSKSVRDNIFTGAKNNKNLFFFTLTGYFHHRGGFIAAGKERQTYAWR